MLCCARVVGTVLHPPTTLIRCDPTEGLIVIFMTQLIGRDDFELPLRSLLGNLVYGAVVDGAPRPQASLHSGAHSPATAAAPRFRGAVGGRGGGGDSEGVDDGRVRRNGGGGGGRGAGRSKL